MLVRVKLAHKFVCLVYHEYLVVFVVEVFIPICAIFDVVLFGCVPEFLFLFLSVFRVDKGRNSIGVVVFFDELNAILVNLLVLIFKTALTLEHVIEVVLHLCEKKYYSKIYKYELKNQYKIIYHPFIIKKEGSFIIHKFQLINNASFAVEGDNSLEAVC